MNIIIQVCYQPIPNGEKKEIIMNTDNIETISPNGYDKKHKFSFIKMVSENTYYITEAVYKKLITIIKVEKL